MSVYSNCLGFPFGSLFPSSRSCRWCLEGPAPNPIVFRMKHPDHLWVDGSLWKGQRGMILFPHQSSSSVPSVAQPRESPAHVLPAEMHGPGGPHCRSHLSMKEGIERFLPFQMKMKLTASWKGDFSDLAKMRVGASHSKVSGCQSILQIRY